MAISALFLFISPYILPPQVTIANYCQASYTLSSYKHMPGGLQEGQPRRPETAQAFIIRTAPGRGDSVKEEILPLRRNLEYRGLPVPSDEMLLARKLTDVGVEYINTINREYNFQHNFFPGGNGYLAGNGYGEVLKEDSDERYRIRHCYAAAVYGVTLETLIDMVNNAPEEAQTLRFDRAHWVELYNNRIASVLGFPKAKIETHLPTNMIFTQEDKQTREEIIDPSKTKNIRKYVKNYGLHDITYEETMWVNLPYSIRQFFLDSTTKGLIQGMGGLAEKFHERALTLIPQASPESTKSQSDTKPETNSVPWDSKFWNSIRFDAPLDPTK